MTSSQTTFLSSKLTFPKITLQNLDRIISEEKVLKEVNLIITTIIIKLFEGNEAWSEALHTVVFSGYQKTSLCKSLEPANIPLNTIVFPSLLKTLANQQLLFFKFIG